MKFCAVQFRSTKGDISANLQKHQLLAETAAFNGADVVIFPELSLTGYEPSIANDLALNHNDHRFSILQKVSDDRQIVLGVGLPLRTAEGIKIAVAIFRPLLPWLFYFKQHLHQDENPYFVPGDQDLLLQLGKYKMAPAICYESLLTDHSDRAGKADANIYFASVAKSEQGIDKANARMPEVAKKHRMPVLMANSVGPSDNFIGFGNTSVWDEDGHLRARLDHTSEGLLIYDADSKTVVGLSHDRGDSEFITEFLERTLPRPMWTHEAHLRFAWLILRTRSLDEACVYAKEKIDHYNQKVGFNIGYHDTITKAYLRLVRDRMSKAECASFRQFRERNPDLFEPGLKSLSAFYSKERLWLPKAKIEFVEPDLQPLPSNPEA